MHCSLGGGCGSSCPRHESADEESRVGAHCAGRVAVLQCRDASEDTYELGAQFSIAPFGTCAARDEEHVDGRQHRLGESELFADHATNAIAHDGVLGNTSRDRHAKAGAHAGVCAVLDFEQGTMDAPRSGAQRGEISRSQQARRAWQAQSRLPCYGIRCLRPFARRAFSTARPPRVFMRARKPCVRACLSLPGWKVRFIAVLEVRSG